MNSPTVKINFFGAFKKYGDHEILPLPAQCSAADLKNILVQHLSAKIANFSDGRLVCDSVIACNDTIVGPQHIVRANDDISILPPVCGG